MSFAAGPMGMVGPFSCRRERARRERFFGGRLMDGIHLLGEWYGCPADTPVFTRAETLRDACLKAVEQAGLTVVGERFFQFQPQGVTGTVLLAESHLAIHTWPEAGFVTVDVYVCNYTTDNSDKAERVFRALQEVLKPQRTRFQAIRRGGKDDGPPA
jgi:S-adenosylmethionine decarboxylase proenzyme